MSERTAVTVFYDADCGICSQSARLLRRLDRAGRLEMRPLASALGLGDAPPREVLLAALHVREASGRWSAGGEAILRICRDVPFLRPFGAVAGLPLIHRLVEPAYGLVAGNRHRISRLLGMAVCHLDSRA